MLPTEVIDLNVASLSTSWFYYMILPNLGFGNFMKSNQILIFYLVL
jgi:uncharacterized membrane protein